MPSFCKIIDLRILGNSKEMINNEASSAYALSKLKTFRQKLT